MRLDDASLAIRPRSAWEALDVGVLLARRHARLLMLSWALVTLPVFILISLLLWQYPTLSVLLFWWLKPLYERLPLFILSRVLFGDTPTVRQSLKALPGLLRSQWLASLTWRRFGLRRSFELPVLQLESLSGSARQLRLGVLGQRDARAATWLTLVGMHLEMGLWLGALALMYLLIPSQLLANWKWQDLLGMDSDWLLFEHLSNLLYALALVIWEPIYVACGFSLYLNRRTALEAWDIELAFRRLHERLKSVLPAVVLAMGLWSIFPTSDALAAPDESETAPLEHMAPVQPSERLINQPLTGKAARERIAEIIDQPPFSHRESVTRWRLGETAEGEPGWFARLLGRWLGSGSLAPRFDRVAGIMEVILWSALFGLIAALLWRYRVWIKLYAAPLRRPRTGNQPQASEETFGVDVRAETLPADLMGEVQRLWNDEPRKALGLLYRAFLSQLQQDKQLPLTAASTEGELLDLLREYQQPHLLHYAERLTENWLNVAYGQRPPSEADRQALCDGWRELFGSRPQA